MLSDRVEQDPSGYYRQTWFCHGGNIPPFFAFMSMRSDTSLTERYPTTISFTSSK